MKKTFKRNAIAAAGAATILSLVFASPSLATSHSVKKASSSSSSSSSGSNTWSANQGAPELKGTFAKLAATVTGVPSTVTAAMAAGHGAYFTVYVLDAAATAAPATAPTTGGIRLEVRGGTLATGTLTGDIPLKGGAASTTTKYAIYPSTTGGTAIFATVTVDAAGVATVTSSGALTAAYDATVAASAPAFGPRDGKGFAKGGPRDGKGGPRDGKGPKGQPGTGAPAGIAATVNVPTDGKTYSIKVTETAEKGVAVTTPETRPAMPITSTGAVSVKLPLGPGDTYKVELVAADGTVAATVTVTVNADGTVTTPITLG